MVAANALNLVIHKRMFTMIKIQLDPNGKEKLHSAAQKSLQHSKTAARWLRQKIKPLKPTRKTLLKGGVIALLLGMAAGAGANYLPKMLGQSRITAVQAAQAAFGVTHGGIITEAEFDIGKRGSRYEFEILSGGRKYEVNVDAMSGRAWVEGDD